MVIYKFKSQEKLREAADDIVRRIVALVNPQRVVLFGSVARNEAGPASDVDLIVVQDTELSFKERTAMMYDEIDHDVDIDVIWYTPNELEALRQTSAFVRHAVAGGETIYEQSKQN